MCGTSYTLDVANMNEPGLRYVQNYSESILFILLGVFLIVFVAFVLYFVAFYTSVFGLQVNGSYAISANTQLIGGFLASLLVVIGIICLVAGSKKYYVAERYWKVSRQLDHEEYVKVANLKNWPDKNGTTIQYPWRAHLPNMNDASRAGGAGASDSTKSDGSLLGDMRFFFTNLFN